MIKSAAEQCPRPEMFRMCINAPKGPSYYPNISCFSFTYVIIKIMLLECFLKTMLHEN